jgi:hypothetical protein
MTEEPLTLGSLLAFIRERMRMKWGDGPIQSPTDQALCRFCKIPFPQMKPGWPPAQGA